MKVIQNYLDQTYATYHRPEYLGTDPLIFPHQFKTPADQEVVAILAAVLAYGNVRSIQNSVKAVLDILKEVDLLPSHAIDLLCENNVRLKVRKRLKNFVHRFTKGEDIFSLLEAICESRKNFKSVGGHFQKHYSAQHSSIEPALNSFLNDWRDYFPSRKNFLLTSPADGSCCKRWMMLLRWLVRKDEIDLGLWKGISTSHLVIPLDTHTGRISRELGLTKRNATDWQTAVEVTEALRKYDAVDPVRFDFSMCRAGMLK